MSKSDPSDRVSQTSKQWPMVDSGVQTEWTASPRSSLHVTGQDAASVRTLIDNGSRKESGQSNAQHQDANASKDLDPEKAIVSWDGPDDPV